MATTFTELAVGMMVALLSLLVMEATLNWAHTFVTADCTVTSTSFCTSAWSMVLLGSGGDSGYQKVRFFYHWAHQYGSPGNEAN